MQPFWRRSTEVWTRKNQHGVVFFQHWYPQIEYDPAVTHGVTQDGHAPQGHLILSIA